MKIGLKTTLPLLAATVLMLTGCTHGSNQAYPPNSPEAKSGKLLSDRKLQVSSLVALSSIYYCKHNQWPPTNTLKSQNYKLSQSFSSLQNYTDKAGYHIRFVFKQSPLDATHNPQWLLSIHNTPSSRWHKEAVYLPVYIQGISAGKTLKNIQSPQQFKVECKPNSAWQ